MLNSFKKTILVSIFLLLCASTALADGYNVVEEKLFFFPKFGGKEYYVSVVENNTNGSKDVFIGKRNKGTAFQPKRIKEPAFFVLSQKLSDLGCLPTKYFGKMTVIAIEHFSNAVRIEIQCQWQSGTDTYWIYYFGDNILISKQIYLSKKDNNTDINVKEEENKMNKKILIQLN